MKTITRKINRFTFLMLQDYIEYQYFDSKYRNRKNYTNGNQQIYISSADDIEKNMDSEEPNNYLLNKYTIYDGSVIITLHRDTIIIERYSESWNISPMFTITCIIIDLFKEN